MGKALEGRSAFITGGAGGIGLASALHLARDGAAVALMGRTLASLDAGAARIREEVPDAQVTVVTGDACVDADVGAAVAHATKSHGRLDIVVATVGGGGGGGPITNRTGDEFMA